MYLAAYMVVGFLIAGAYAWAWLRGRRSRYGNRALTVALTSAALAAPAQIVVGDSIARQVVADQPTKLAAFEGLGETQRDAAIHIGGWYNEDPGEVEHGLPLPHLLSLVAYHDPNAEVQGLDEVPAIFVALFAPATTASVPWAHRRADQPVRSWDRLSMGI